MKERLLQFIWQYQYFNRQDLRTAEGESLTIIFPGKPNNGQGPDFLDASIRIDGQRWFGNIELHILHSDWRRHAHHRDPHYRNVILHVVWDFDNPDCLPAIPVLTLQDRVPGHLLDRYAGWMANHEFVPCGQQAAFVGAAPWTAWKKSLLLRRLERKTLDIQTRLQANNQHWEETTWLLIARSFGLAVNADCFESVAASLPLSLLSRHRDRPDLLEALLLGQAGLLQGLPADEYCRGLQKEYAHLRTLYRLSPVYRPVLFLRMRPGNLPAVRLAQLAALLSRSTSWFALIRECPEPDLLLSMIDVCAADYWTFHYMPGLPAPPKIKRVGRAMRERVLINCFVPMLYASGKLLGVKTARDKALYWLQKTCAEKNAQIAGWGRLGIQYGNAADTQALLELKNCYCEPRNCLDCAIGRAILSLGLPESGLRR